MIKFFQLALLTILASCAHYYTAEEIDQDSGLVTIKNDDKDYALKLGESVYIFEYVCERSFKGRTKCGQKQTVSGEIIEISNDIVKLKLKSKLKTGRISFIRHQLNDEATKGEFVNRQKDRV